MDVSNINKKLLDKIFKAPGLGSARTIQPLPGTFERMKAVRVAVRHLWDGGAVLILPGGGIDPDPAV